MSTKKRSIKDRIAETTAKARETFVPVDHGPDPRLHRHEVAHAVHQQAEQAGGSFEESFDYADPQGERYLPEGMDGVIQIKTRGEVAAEEALAKAIKDPTSVLAPRQYGEKKERRDIADAGHELAKRQVSEAHDKDYRARVAAGLGINPFDAAPVEPTGSVPPEVEETLAREETGPHAPSIACKECGGGVGEKEFPILDADGRFTCAACKAKGA